MMTSCRCVQHPGPTMGICRGASAGLETTADARPAMAPASAEISRDAASAAAGKRLKSAPHEALPRSFQAFWSFLPGCGMRGRTRGTCLDSSCARLDLLLSYHLHRTSCDWLVGSCSRAAGRERDLSGPEGSKASPKLREAFAHLAKTPNRDISRASFFSRLKATGSQLRRPTLLVHICWLHRDSLKQHQKAAQEKRRIQGSPGSTLRRGHDTHPQGFEGRSDDALEDRHCSHPLPSSLAVLTLSRVSETNTAAIDAPSTSRAPGSPVASPLILSKVRLAKHVKHTRRQMRQRPFSYQSEEDWRGLMPEQLVQSKAGEAHNLEDALTRPQRPQRPQTPCHAMPRHATLQRLQLRP